jgi:HEAT repeat protein/transcriptional regulator with XRE-family HTH domain/energy-coupling factor transporter ATP-binding protein EcfA2
MAEVRDRGSVLATEEGIQILKDAKAAKRNHNGKTWTYQDIANESGVANKTVARFFRLERPIDESSARTICQALGVHFDKVVEIRPGTCTSEEGEYETKWREICRELLSYWKGLTTNAITKPGVRFQLNEIFVPLGVVERREKPKHPSNDSSSAEQGSELYEEKTTPLSQDDFFEQVLRQRRSKYSQGSRIAIIGEPGAGKTTQLQKIGDWILEKTDGIPIWIPLTAVGARKLREYLLNDWLQTATQELEVLQEHRDELGQLLKTGKVCLLLDGVDEMAVSDALYQIDTQMREGWLRNVRVVLTCRLNVWDVGKNVLDNFDVYRTLNFDYPTEVHRFIDKWFATEPELQQKLKIALEQPGKERIRDMVKNPLRLTLLCYSWQLRQGELPETKAGLYEWFVDAFYEWNKGKVPTKLSVTKREELNHALGELAKEAIDQESSRFRLREKFVNQFLGAADNEDSLFYLALKLGWLNRVGVAEENPLENVYAFFHPTFQEYFAALAILDFNFLLNHALHEPNEGTYRLFEPQWKEVILLWFGQNEKLKLQKENFFNSLIDFQDRCGDFYYYQAYLMAAESTAEFNNNNVNEVVEQIIRWSFHASQSVAHIWPDSPLEEQAKKLLYRADPVKITNSLISLMQADPLKSLSASKKHHLSQSLFTYQETLEKITDALSINSMKELKLKLTEQSKPIFEILDSIVQHDMLCLKIIEVLIQIGSRNPIIIETLDKLLKDDLYKLPLEDLRRVRFFASKTLESIHPGNPQATQILLELLVSTNNLDEQNKKISFLTLEIETLLQKISKNNFIVLEGLIHLLQSEQNLSAYEKVAKVLGEVASNDFETIQSLARLIESCQDTEKKFILTQCLGRLNSNHPEFICAVVNILNSLDPRKCYKVIEEIIRTSQPVNPTVGRALIKFIEDVQKYLASTYFNKNGNKDDVASHDHNEFLEEACVFTVEYIVENLTDEMVSFSILEDLLDTIRGDWYLIIIAKSLWKLAPGHKKSQEIFDRFLNTNSSACLDAAWHLILINPNNPKAVNALIKLLRNQHNSNVIDVFSHTDFSKKDNLDIIANLQELLEDEDTVVRSLAAQSLVRIDQNGTGVIQTLVGLLSNPKESTNALHDLSWSLKELDNLDAKTVIVLIQNLIELLRFHHYEGDQEAYCFRLAGDLIIENCPDNLLPYVVQSLKELLKKSMDKSKSVRYRSCYRVIWYCAQNMSYPDFHRVWNSPLSTNTGLRIDD